MSPERNEGIPLWHILHDDGDEEDLDETDLTQALRHYDQNLKEDDNLMNEDTLSDENDDDEDDFNDTDDEVSSRGNNINEITTNTTLWPTSGVRNRWMKAITDSQTIGEISLGLSALIEYGRNFGVISDDVFDTSRTSNAMKYFWIKSANKNSNHTPNPKNNSQKKSSMSYVDDYKRPSRAAAKKVASYAEY